MTKADKRRSGKLAGSVLMGGALDEALADYDLIKITGEAYTWDEPRVRALTVVSSPATGFPQSALVVSRFPAGKRKHRADRVVYDLARPSAQQRWLVRTRMPVKAKKITRLVAAIASPSVPVDQGRRIDGIAVNQLSRTLAAAFNHPGGRAARRFRRDPYRSMWRKEVSRWGDRHRRVTATFDSSGPSVAWPTRSGGTVAIVPGTWTIKEVMLDGWSFYYPKRLSRPMHRKLPHLYHAGRWDHSTTSIVSVPATGRLRLVHTHASLSYLSVERDDG